MPFFSFLVFPLPSLIATSFEVLFANFLASLCTHFRIVLAQVVRSSVSPLCMQYVSVLDFYNQTNEIGKKTTCFSLLFRFTTDTTASRKFGQTETRSVEM